MLIYLTEGMEHNELTPCRRYVSVNHAARHAVTFLGVACPWERRPCDARAALVIIGGHAATCAG